MEIQEPSWFIDPYIVKGGITFIWGDTSIGKSPLTWAMAKSIGEGSHFFGLPASKGRVLYLELDTPENGLIPRLKKTPSAANVWWLFEPGGLSLPLLEGDQREALANAARDLSPEVVFINTLRKAHDLDDKDSRAPKIVYSYFQKAFPDAALVFVHHLRKRSTNPDALEHDKEGFSGAKNWLNDAQVGLHLETYNGSLRLYHRKSQVSGMLRPLSLRLSPDGTNLSSPSYEELREIHSILTSFSDLPAVERDQMIVRAGIAESLGTAKRKRLLVESGAFPGSRRWLEKEPQLEDPPRDPLRERNPEPVG